MDAKELLRLFSNLPVPTGSSGGADQETYSAIELPPATGYRVGKAPDGSPAFLVSSAAAPAGIDLPIRLKHLSVRPSMPCSIETLSGQRMVEPLLVIHCTDADSFLAPHFLSICANLAEILGPEPSSQAVAEAVFSLVELFRALERPGESTAQGLWAELFVIARSSDPQVSLEAWRTRHRQPYDFSLGNEHVEVKSCGCESREHIFSLTQLAPEGDEQVVIASVFTRLGGNARSLSDLRSMILDRLRSLPDLRLKLDTVIGKTLGECWWSIDEVSFDYDIAVQSQAFYRSDQIPSVDPHLPPGVERVSFSSDLTGVRPIPADELRTLGTLFCAVSPARR